MSLEERHIERQLSYEHYLSLLDNDDVLEPTHALPGSPEKLAVLCLRLNHPDCKELFLEEDIYKEANFQDWNTENEYYKKDSYQKEVNSYQGEEPIDYEQAQSHDE